MKPNTIAGAFLVAIAVLPSAGDAAEFRDVLDTPAAASAIAARSLLNGIAVAGGRLVAAGAHGRIVYSEDQGRSWRQASVPVSSDLTAVCFPSRTKGWAVGHDGVVLHSADGGTTWSKQLDGRDVSRIVSAHYGQHALRRVAGADEAEVRKEIDRIVAQGPDKPFLDVWFDDERTGFVVGAFNLVLRTVDGGKTWEPWLDRTENPGGLHLYAIRRIGQQLFAAGEQGLVLKLDPRTEIFERMKVPYNGSFFGITGNERAVVAFGLRGNVFLSTDTGRSWKKVDAGASSGLTGGTATPEGHLVLVGQGGEVLVSRNSGATFAPLGAQTSFPATAVAAVSDRKLAVTGLLGVQLREFN